MSTYHYFNILFTFVVRFEMQGEIELFQG